VRCRNEDAGVRLGWVKREKSLPDFPVIGAQKAGTKLLTHNLRLYPQIWLPEGEVHYFDCGSKADLCPQL
jgi:hypothetical protein